IWECRLLDWSASRIVVGHFIGVVAVHSLYWYADSNGIPGADGACCLPGWHQVVQVFVVYILLDVVLVNIVEPWVYGSNTGISSLAILFAAVFWSTIWGPVGLILSTPMTVCLILIGRYVPQLAFLEVLLGDEAPLPTQSRFYQRLLALDQEEAREIADEYMK